MLSIIVFLPLIGAALVALLPREQERHARVIATITALAVFGLSIALFAMYDRDLSGFQFLQRRVWIDSEQIGFTVQYLLGVDGLSVTLVLLTGFLSLTAIMISWNVGLRPREYFAWLLVLETSLMGVFTSLDLLLFVLFWEIELVPMYFLISIWGTGRKEYSAIKYFIYTMAGSAFLIVGVLILGFSVGTFDLIELSRMEIRDVLVPLPALFFLLLVAFAVKLPVVPFHTWLPDAHTDAPTAVSVMLAGVLLKMGGYGIFRVSLSILPEVAQDAALWLAAFAAMSIIYGAIVTLRQTDLKRLIAYSSVSHMGYVLLGVSALGEVSLAGAALQMFTHGTITGLLFIMVGLVYERTHTRDIQQMSGLAHQVPLLAVVMVIAGLASLGLPSLAGFAAEITVFLGTFPRFEAATIVGIVGIVLTAGYILWMIQRVFFGPRSPRWEGLPDATAWWEQVPMAALVAAIIVIGVYPAVLLDIIDLGIQPIVLRLG